MSSWRMKRARSSTDVEEEETELYLKRCCKNSVAAIYAAGDRSEQRAIRNAAEKAGIQLTTRTWRSWKANVRQKGRAVKLVHDGGRPKTFSEDHLTVIMGFIYNAIMNHSPVSNEDVRDWVSENLQIDCSAATIMRATTAMGFSSRMTKTKRTGYTLDRNKSAQLYRKFVSEKAHPIFRQHVRKHIGSFDFTYTSHQNDRILALSVVGGYVTCLICDFQ